MSEPVRPNRSIETDDDELVRALKRGDDSAFERLVRGHSAAMLRVARRVLKNEEDAREALQDAFVSAFKAIGRFEGGARLSTWLHRIAVNAALMKLRSKQRRPETSLDELLPKFLPDGHAATQSVPWAAPADQLAEQRELRALVRELIGELPDSYRIVLLLRDIEEIPTEEVARLLEATPNAIKIRVHRARQALRTLLDARLHGAGAARGSTPRNHGTTG
jgi:RNA polymerase sigma-70 factor (ECF subfamily)